MISKMLTLSMVDDLEQIALFILLLDFPEIDVLELKKTRACLGHLIAIPSGCLFKIVSVTLIRRVPGS